MKRLIIVLCVVAFLVALPMSHLSAAGKGPAPKVKVCHITGVNDAEPPTGFVGHVIEVSANALSAHCAHGDHQPNPNKPIGATCRRRFLNPSRRCDGAVPLPPNWYE